jgi:hypothetical protein
MGARAILFLKCKFPMESGSNKRFVVMGFPKEFLAVWWISLLSKLSLFYGLCSPKSNGLNCRQLLRVSASLLSFISFAYGAGLAL